MPLHSADSSADEFVDSSIDDIADDMKERTKLGLKLKDSPCSLFPIGHIKVVQVDPITMLHELQTSV